MTALNKLNGVFAVFKKSGVTSASLTKAIRLKLLTELNVPFEGDGRKWLKVGHGGTLDLEAEGVLVVAVGHGCRHLKNFLHGNKCYLCVAELGTATDTYDFSGEVTQRLPFDHVTEVCLESALHNFVGTILQVPPRYSALKYQGRRLSDYAREGRHVPAPWPRAVSLLRARCASWNPPQFTLALGTCCHLVKLQRTEQGAFTMKMTLKEDEISVDNVLNGIQQSKSILDSQMGVNNAGRKAS